LALDTLEDACRQNDTLARCRRQPVEFDGNIALTRFERDDMAAVDIAGV
jgi:hypothetical protein